MRVYREEHVIESNGELDIIDLTGMVMETVSRSGIKNGIVNIFSPCSTCAITILEYEDGLLSDIKVILDKIAPSKMEYKHNYRWGDDNGHSHIRASLIKPSITFPVINGELYHGTWQQIIFIELDVRPRTRRVIISVLGE